MCKRDRLYIGSKLIQLFVCFGRVFLIPQKTLFKCTASILVRADAVRCDCRIFVNEQRQSYELSVRAPNMLTRGAMNEKRGVVTQQRLIYFCRYNYLLKTWEKAREILLTVDECVLTF